MLLFKSPIKLLRITINYIFSLPEVQASAEGIYFIRSRNIVLVVFPAWTKTSFFEFL